VVPARHFPRTAGLLAANAVAAGFAVAGIEPAAYVAGVLGFLTVFYMSFGVPLWDDLSDRGGR